MKKPTGGKPGPAGFALSDDFSKNRFGVQWTFHDPAPDEMQRVHYEHGALRLDGRGTSPVDSAPLTCPVGDRAYEAEVTLEIDAGGEAGVLLFYNHKAFVGLTFTPEVMKTWQYAEEQTWSRTKMDARSARVRLTNIDNVVTYHYSLDAGKTWTRHPTRMEVSGLNHNVFGGFMSLKIGIVATGSGSVRLRDFAYRAVSENAA